MTASMFQGEGQYTDVVGAPTKPIAALSQGSQGVTMSDLQLMQQNERKQHEQAYIYENGHNDGSAPGWEASF